MGKILSICVPSYNMEEYLKRCMDTFLVPEVIDQLEIIIVNDGSTDGTLAIANEYKEKYPQSIVVIDKPNGHYGSCVNASLKVATGKYFRIVDADDWVDSDALVEFVNKLAQIDVDCVCANYTIHNLKDDTVTVKDVNLPSNVILELNSRKIPEECLHMHNLTYSTDLLKRINYTQTEGICYTDTEYVYLPLSCSRDMVYFNLSLYQYFIGRDDQSMAPEVFQKNFKQQIIVLERIFNEHYSSLPFNANEKSIWNKLLDRLAYLTTPIYLMYKNYDERIDSLLRKTIRLADESGNESVKDLWSSTILKIPYISIWYSIPSASKCLFPLIHFLRRLR